MAEEPIVLQVVERNMLVARLLMKPIVSLAFIFIFGLVQIARFGNVKDYLFLITGSCLAAVLIGGYSFIPLLDRGKKSWGLTFLALAGSIPYLFGCYLVFYRGFWKLKDLLARFSILHLLSCVVFVVLGYWVVSGLYLVTEYVKSVGEKEIILK